jgi:DNA-binding SARP family transcriptional activator
MDFRLLGPLDVRDGEHALALRRGKPRVLLTRLLLEPGRTVSADALIDALWGERPPPTATKALHVYVRGLRQTIGAERILTQGSGYQLRVEPEEVDVRRFEALAGRGRAALTAGDPAGGAAQLREALGLWRGAALADAADEPFARGEAARLEDLRLAVLEDRIAADVQLGRHAECVGELERLVAEEPLRERLHGQLMLALYRSGRQADALGAYWRARRVLVDELGLEPGPELQAVERSILAHDPALEPPAPPPPAPSGAERKLATVVVIELAAASGDADSERLAARLERGRQAAAETLRAAGGQVELGIGGSLLAAFGAPAAQEDHAERALHAAIALRETADTAVAVRIGVESGEVLAEGSAVAGAPVIAAARLAGAAPAGAVAVGERVVAATRGVFRVVDGTLAGADPARSRRGSGGARPAFVGRRDELALLGATWTRVTGGGRPQLVTVVGDAGIGKTSLLVALRGRLGPGVPWYVGRCLAYGRAITYRPVAEITRLRLGLHAAQDAGEQREFAPLLGPEPDAGLHPWEARERLRAAWIDLLDDLGSDGPAVVWIEDLHWANDALLELFEQGLREATGPLLLVATARPELLGRRPGWGGGSSDASRLHLDPLGTEEAAAMLERLVPGLPAEVAAQVLERAEGNPFFVEEALASLLDRGALRRTASGWDAGGVPAAPAVPDSVQAVIASRIDLLPAADKGALQAAAVIGRTFWEGAVRALTGSPSASLALLVERDFVRRTHASAVPGEREFSFKHALTREVAFGSVPMATRARLHADFAAWLEGVGGERDDDAPLLAHHYAEAVAPADADLAWVGEEDRARDLRARAVRWMKRAAELATGRYAIDDTLALLAGARELEPDPAAKAQLWHATATAHRFVYDIDAFRVAIEEAVALAPDAPVAARAYADLGHAGSQPWMWRDPPSTEVVDGWIAAALDHAGCDDAARAMALIARAQTRPHAGAADADEALMLAERLEEPIVRAKAIDAATVVAATQGRLHDSAAWSERAVANAGALPDRNQRSGALLLAVMARLWVGRIADARQLAVEHDALATPLGAHNAVHAVAAHLFVATAAGDWAAARAIARRAESACEANADTPCQFNWRSLLMVALGCACLGDDREARRLEEVAAEALTIGGPLGREPALLRLAMVRSDRTAIEELLEADAGPDFWDVGYRATRLDALALVGDVARVEAEAEEAIAVGGYVEPFALRALGVVRADSQLRADAAARFAAMGLPPDGPPGLVPGGPQVPG